MNKKIISISIVSLLLVALGFIVYKSSVPTGYYQASTNLPSFALKDEQTKLAYTYALEKQEQFEYIACYCGCGTHEMMHRGKIIPKMNSLKECFIRSDGTFEDHAAFDCPACVSVALEASKMLNEGKSLRDVRIYIDSKYGVYGGGTNTPYPS